MQQQLVGRSKNVFEEVRMRGNDDYFVPIECEHPCHHDPGTVEKIKTLKSRLERGEELFHPRDAKMHATYEQSIATRDYVALELMTSDSTPAHIKQRIARKREIEAIKSSPDYVTEQQLQREFGIPIRAVQRYLRSQNPRFVFIKGSKYYLRSSLAPRQ
jgi:hypothetical protein